MKCFLLAVTITTLSSSARAGDFVEVDHDVGKLHLYRAEPEEVSLHWLGDDQRPMRTFSKVGASIFDSGRQPLMLTNAGIFEPNGTPSGLHVQDGQKLRPINLADAPEGKEYWNFFLKPTGVFWIGKEGQASITESHRYAGEVVETPRLALQSGPLLLRDGEVHPHPEVFRPGNTSLLHRSGVGIMEDGKVLFLMTDFESKTRVNPRTFAELFLEFGCKDALFLDGVVSAMWVAAGEREGEELAVDPARELAPAVVTGNHFGAVLAVTRPKADAEEIAPVTKE